MPKKRSILLLMPLLIMNACTIGPKMLSYTPLAYNMSAQQTQNEQMLINLVRVRYSEQPFFLQIGSISSSYSYGATAGGSISVPRTELPAVGVMRTITGTLQGTYQELPTFTFSPLQGRQYFEYLLRDIDLTELAILENWDVGFFINTLVERIGNTYNDPVPSNRTYKAFLALGAALTAMRQRHDLEFLNTKEGHLLKLTYRDGAEAARIETLLGVSKRIDIHKGVPLVGIYRLIQANDLVSGTEDPKGRPIVRVKLRSFLKVLSVLCQGVDVPPEDLDKGFVVNSQAALNRPSDLQTIRIHHSTGPPKNALVTAAYRGRWFYIADTDIVSKQIFALLNLIFSLQSQSVISPQPALTIPVR